MSFNPVPPQPRFWDIIRRNPWSAVSGVAIGAGICAFAKPLAAIYLGLWSLAGDQ